MRGVAHSPAFKAKMIEKMLSPDGPSAYALAAESNVAQTTLSRWKREALTMGGMSNKRKQSGRKSRRKRWTAAEKLRLVQQSSELSDDELGEFLRREGVHAQQLEQWREAMHEALGERTSSSRLREQKLEQENRSLRHDLKRKDKALAESAALLWLKKKAEEIWGDEDDDTSSRNGG